jgi:hypothetical protein
MRSTLLRFCFAAAAVSASVSAFATPPWYVDWSHTVDFQKLAVRIYYLSNQAGLKRSQSLPRVQIAYGLTRNLEINLRSEDLFKSSTSAPMQGFGDTQLGMKWRFYKDKRDSEIGLGYAYLLQTGLQGVSSKANPQTPYLMASITPGKFGFYTVLGETYPDSVGLKDDTYGGLLVSYDLCKRWQLLGEVYGNTATAEGVKEDLEAAAGFYYTATKDTKWFARVGHSFEGYSDLNITVGVQLMVKGQ